MTALYNEIDPFAAQWLRNLIAAGHIAPGVVDERSIVDLTPDDVRGYTQFHAFAGIGVWSHALRLAGWPDARPVWTASLPCQPFSAAGKRQGHADERNLAEVWLRLACECRPPVCIGEQVEPAIGFNWLDALFIRLEQSDYACGAAVFPAASVGAPHIRSRVYWVADHARAGQLRAAQHENDGAHRTRGWGYDAAYDSADVGSTATAGFWRDAIWLPCRDGKARPTESGVEPLAHGATQRVGRLRAYGNAIVGPQAAEFVRALK